MTDSQSSPEPNFAKIDKLVGQIEKNPRSKEFIPLAEEYVKAGLLQEAALTLEDGLKVYPSFVTALVRLGGVYLQLQNLVQAQNRLEEAIKNSPDNILAHRMLAKLHMLNHNVECASQSSDKVLRENPFDKEMLDLQREIEKSTTLTSDTVVPQVSMQDTEAQTSTTEQGTDSPETLDTALSSHESEEAITSPSPVQEEGTPVTSNHLQQHLEKLSQLLERIQERRVA